MVLWRRGGGDSDSTNDFLSVVSRRKSGMTRRAATEELSRFPETAAWGTRERERVAPWVERSQAVCPLDLIGRRKGKHQAGG